MHVKCVIPDAALEQHGVVLGKTGAGKSYAMRGIVEYLLHQKKRVCVVDPKGDWYGLRSGFPVVIFGGPHADIPLNERLGTSVGELIATTARPSIIDFGGWMPGERTRFWIDFAGALFRHNAAPLWLIIDEVHNFAPQGRIMDPNSGKALHWTNRLASEGRGKGLKIWMASQRPQKVAKDTLTCAETLVAMRVVHPRDRDALVEWIDCCGDPAVGRDMMDGLAQIARGTGWVWSPEIAFLQKVVFPRIATFDSFSPPTSETVAPKWQEIKLDEIRDKFAGVVKEAEANDPANLKKKIAELTKQLTTRVADPAEMTELKKTLGLQRDQIAADSTTIKIQADTITELNGRIHQIGNLCVQSKGPARPTFISDDLMAKTASLLAKRSVLPALRATVPARPTATSNLPTFASDEGAVHLSEAHRRILITILEYGPITLESMGVRAGFQISGGTFKNNLSFLRVNGLLQSEGRTFDKTEHTAKAIGGYEPLPAGSALLEFWIAKLGGKPGEILRALQPHYPEFITREQVAEAVGVVASGGTFKNQLSELRTRNLITPGKDVRLADELVD